MSILFVTALIFTCYYFLSFRLKLECPHQKIIFAGLGAFGQMILTQLFLGITGLLYLPHLILLNIVIALTVIIASGVIAKGGCLVLQDEIQMTNDRIRNIFTPLNFLMSILVLYLFIWILGVIYFYPYREFDAVTYHLPAIYQYIIEHKISLLPLDINLRFVFPENAELLFMWPAIFLHSQIFIAAIQLVLAAWGAVVLYGLARMLDIHPKNSLFISFLFLLTPVVMSQMACCYIDLITSVFILTLLYAAGMFYKTNRLVYFYSTAFAAGLLWGMKYNEILYILMVLPLLLGGPKLVTKKHWFGFMVIFLMAGGYWYLRNFLELRAPIYPVPFSKESLHIYSGHIENVTAIEFLKLIPYKLYYIWNDRGLGRLYGGYGLIFWGLAIPAWFYIWIRAIKQKRNFDLLIYSPLIVGIGQLTLASIDDNALIARYSLFVVALGLLALEDVMKSFDTIVLFKKAIKTLCVLCSILFLVHLSVNKPEYRIDAPFKSFVTGKYLTREAFNFKYLALWGLLDYLTLNDPKGLTCYITTTDEDINCNISAGYGTHLQNRIWDFEQDKNILPDAFIYSFPDNNGVLKKTGPQITFEEMKHNSDYLLVYQYARMYLFIRKSFFNDPSKKKLLAGYYKNLNWTMPTLRLN